MAFDERTRHQLYLRLEEVLGPEEATILMEHLPPVGWADVATKRDLQLLRTEFRADLQEGLREQAHRLYTFTVTVNAASILAVAALAFAAAKLV
jgi:hypothetical protein